jgi:hypothetical protein
MDASRASPARAKSGSAGLGGDPPRLRTRAPARRHGRHPIGALFITDSYNDRILKIVP